MVRAKTTRPRRRRSLSPTHHSGSRQHSNECNLKRAAISHQRKRIGFSHPEKRLHRPRGRDDWFIRYFAAIEDELADWAQSSLACPDLFEIEKATDCSTALVMFWTVPKMLLAQRP